MKEREISLIDLLFEILLKWRMIVVFMVIGGVLLGGYSYIKSVKAVEAQKATENTEITGSVDKEEITLEQLEKELTIVQKNNVETVLSAEEYNEYYKSSVLMQMDAKCVPTKTLIFDVTTSNEKDKVVIISVYTQIINRGFVQWLTESGMDAKEAAKVEELVTVSNNVGSQYEVQLSGNKAMITASIMHVDETRCKTLAEEFKKFVFAKETEIEAVYGAIEVTLVDETYATVTNLDILNKQRSIFTNVVSGNTTADKFRQAFSEDEEKYYKLLKNEEIVSEAENDAEVVEDAKQPVVIPNPSFSIKYVILGMVLLAFVYVFYVFIAYIFNNKIRANDDMTELYEIPQLGIIGKTNNKKKFLGFVDAWILSLRDRNKRKFTVEEAKEIVAVAIKMAVKKSDSKAVCLIGCDVKKQTEDICSSIKALLEKEGINVSILDNVLYNAEEMEKLSDADNVVLVEKTGATMYDEVAKELELVKRYNINVLGGVLVE